MLSKSRKQTTIIYLLLGVMVLALGVGSFVHHVGQLRDTAESVFRSRSELMTKFVAVHRDRVTVMRDLLLEHYAQTGAAAGQFDFHAYPQWRGWEAVSKGKQSAGSFSGSGALPGKEVQRAMQAALAMDVQTRAALEFDPEVVWMYFQSADNFIYMAPHTAIGQFHFDPQVYNQRYWLEALPAANPERRMVLAGPYRDMAGKGWLLTFSLPVYMQDKFLGVVALDLKIDTMRQLISVGEAIGGSKLISENNRLVAKQHGQVESEDIHLYPPHAAQGSSWQQDVQGDWWLQGIVVKDELMLAHRISRRELYLAAARESATDWIMLLLFGLFAAMAWRLQGVLHQMIRLTHIDPLTQALNRRGFYEKSLTTFALGKRENLLAAFLIMDIDFFKKVNDTYGHAEGDSVLKQLGGYLLQARRPSDLVCRWGGEEFVLLLLVKDAEEASAVAERMRQQAMRSRIQPGDLPVTLSGGLVLMRAGEALDEAAKRADELLYQAKQGGRNRIVQDLQH